MTNPQDGMSVEEVLERAEPGQWVVHTSWGINVRKIGKVTAKLVKFDGGWAPRQVDHSKVIAVFADKEDADRFKQSVEGAHGEYSRRVSAARVEYNTRCADAKEAYDKAVAALRSRASSALSREVGKGDNHG